MSMPADHTALRRLDHRLAERMLAVARANGTDRVFRARVLELPSMLQRSGLAASLVYLLGRDDQSRTAAGAIAAEVADATDDPQLDDPLELLEWIATDAKPGDLAVGQQRARLAAMWLKRMVEALESWPVEEVGTDGEGDPEDLDRTEPAEDGR